MIGSENKSYNATIERLARLYNQLIFATCKYATIERLQHMQYATIERLARLYNQLIFFVCATLLL